MNTNKPLSYKDAVIIWTYLVSDAGASPYWIDGFDFIRSQCVNVIYEYRFQGGLGFGGKFRRDRDTGRIYVDCYPEDMNDERRTMIDNTNKLLSDIRLWG